MPRKYCRELVLLLLLLLVVVVGVVVVGVGWHPFVSHHWSKAALL